MKNLLCCLVITALFLHSCKDKNCPGTLIYQIPYTVSPVRDTFSLGDTVWMEMDFSEVMVDVHEIQNSFPNFDFRLEVQCGKFDTEPEIAKTVEFLAPINLVGETIARVLPISSVSYFEAIPAYTDHSYHFKSAFVLKQTGTFLCGISSISDITNPFAIVGNCDNLPLYIQTRANGGDTAINNYHLLKSSPIPVYYNMTKERFIEGGGSCFVVK